MTLVNDINKLQNQLRKKESEKVRFEKLIQDYSEKLEMTNNAIQMIQAQIITANLVANHMTFDDLQLLLTNDRKGTI